MERTMSMAEAFKAFWTKAFVFNERSRRREYWLSLLANIIVMFVLAFILLIIDAVTGFRFGIMDIFDKFLTYVLPVLMIFPSLAIGIRRLHDINISGIPYVIYYILDTIVLVLTWTIFYQPSDEVFNTNPALLIVQIVMLVAALVFMILAMIPGTKGPNKYGEDPKYSY